MIASLSDLNPYSARFAERLFAEHPEWRSLAVRDPEGYPAPGSLLVEVPSPVRDRKLTIRTYGDQVTIDYGPHGWHDHFDLGKDALAKNEFDASLAFIRDLMSEHVVVTTRILFGRCLGSRAVRTADVRPPRLGRLEIYSWTGKHDAR